MNCTKKAKTKRVINPETRDTLYRTLEETSRSMEHLRQISSSFNEFTQTHISSRLTAMEEKIVYLYGRIDDLLVASELTIIIREAEELEKALATGSVEAIAKKVLILKSQLQTLGESYRLSRNEKQELLYAHTTLKKANDFLKEKTVTRLPTHPFNESEADEDLEPQVMEIWEIADLYYHHKTREASRKFNQLPVAHKELFEKHLRTLGGEKDNMKMIQALLAVASEVAHSCDGEPYLSLEEIQSLFTELDHIRSAC